MELLLSLALLICTAEMTLCPSTSLGSPQSPWFSSYRTCLSRWLFDTPPPLPRELWNQVPPTPIKLVPDSDFPSYSFKSHTGNERFYEDMSSHFWFHFHCMFSFVLSLYRNSPKPLPHILSLCNRQSPHSECIPTHSILPHKTCF